MKTLIAIILYKLGVTPKISWSIGEFTTYGYGKLDFNGHFKYALPPKYIADEN